MEERLRFNRTGNRVKVGSVRPRDGGAGASGKPVEMNGTARAYGGDPLEAVDMPVQTVAVRRIGEHRQEVVMAERRRGSRPQMVRVGRGCAVRKPRSHLATSCRICLVRLRG